MKTIIIIKIKLMIDNNNNNVYIYMHAFHWIYFFYILYIISCLISNIYIYMTTLYTRILYIISCLVSTIHIIHKFMSNLMCIKKIYWVVYVHQMIHVTHVTESSKIPWTQLSMLTERVTPRALGLLIETSQERTAPCDSKIPGSNGSNRVKPQI
jgi:hypothetical protein